MLLASNIALNNLAMTHQNAPPAADSCRSEPLEAENVAAPNSGAVQNTPHAQALCQSIDRTDRTDQSDPSDRSTESTNKLALLNYRFETVLDFVAPLAALASLITLAVGAFAGCRKAA